MAAFLGRVWRATSALTLLASQQGIFDSETSSSTLSTESLDIASETLNQAIEVRPSSPTNVRGAACVVPLASHEFGYSYGTPYVANYSAPDCSADHTVAYLRWTASAPRGTQYDRLAAVWVNGAELLRTSTQEPSARSGGVQWEVVKDVSLYLDLLVSGGQVVISLDNIITDVYNSSFTVDVQLELYEPLDAALVPARPDVIVPVSKSATSYGWFTVEPSSAATGSNGLNVSIPTNTAELFLELFLSHHQCDEFYYANPPDSYAALVDACGGGPFREVQVLVNGALAGIVWPFPLLFTGGLNPYLWRPIVALGAFDAPTYVLNLTPFLGAFIDGQPHNVTFAVSHGIDFWPIDGNLLAYVDAATTQTLVEPLTLEIEDSIEPASSSTNSSGLNGEFFVAAAREWSVQTRVTTVTGGAKVYSLHQSLSFANEQVYSADGYNESFSNHVSVSTSLSVTRGNSTESNSTVTLALTEEYPMTGYSNYIARDDGSFILDAHVANSFARTASVDGDTALLPAVYAVGQVERALDATAIYDSKLGGNGTTAATFASVASSGDCYSRRVTATLGVLVEDVEDSTCVSAEA